MSSRSAPPPPPPPPLQSHNEPSVDVLSEAIFIDDLPTFQLPIIDPDCVLGTNGDFRITTFRGRGYVELSPARVVDLRMQQRGKKWYSHHGVMERASWLHQLIQWETRWADKLGIPETDIPPSQGLEMIIQACKQVNELVKGLVYNERRMGFHIPQQAEQLRLMEFQCLLVEVEGQNTRLSTDRHVNELEGILVMSPSFIYFMAPPSRQTGNFGLDFAKSNFHYHTSEKGYRIVLVDNVKLCSNAGPTPEEMSEDNEVHGCGA